MVWITADVHYAAAHLYDPAQAAFSDFLPFWEFVAGPLNAVTFGPNELDRTFGPRVIFPKATEPGRRNLPPLAGLQSFGELEVDGTTRALTARLRDLEGRVLFERRLEPEVA
ncbi:hypothetical protein HRbin39_00457 [bacterium HR39]|nr:hypothetical protein HRbin39_00457 [bacterium HR39]